MVQTATVRVPTADSIICAKADQLNVKFNPSGGWMG